MTRIIAAFAALAAMAGAASADIATHYTGKRIDTFLGANPGAVSKKGSIYYWRGGVEGTGIPVLNPGPGGGLRDFQVECRLELKTANGVIKSVRITHDTLGQWNLSRCAEVIN